MRIVIVKNIVVCSYHHITVVIYKLILRLAVALHLSLSTTALNSIIYLSSPQIICYSIVASHVHNVTSGVWLRNSLVVIALSDLLRLYIHICDVHHILLLLNIEITH